MNSPRPRRVLAAGLRALGTSVASAAVVAVAAPIVAGYVVAVVVFVAVVVPGVAGVVAESVGCRLGERGQR